MEVDNPIDEVCVDHIVFRVEPSGRPAHHQLRKFFIGGVEKELFIDSGNIAATIMRVDDFNDVMTKTMSKPSKVATASAPRMIAFASQTPLKVVSAMRIDIAAVQAPEVKVMTEVYAVDKASANLLQHDVAVQLKVLRVGFEECASEAAMVHAVFEDNVNGLNIDWSTPEFPAYPDFMFRLMIKDDPKPRCQWFQMVKPDQAAGFKSELERYVSQRIVSPVPKNVFVERVSPALAASKNHGKDVRLVIDFKNLNEDLINKDEVKMPTIESMTSFTKGHRYMAKIDLSSAFLHIVIHPDDRHHTVFFTEYGLFQCNRMMFGLKTAPQGFQHILSNDLTEFKRNAINYLDDILIVADSLQELYAIFDALVAKLKEKNWVINDEKTVKGVTEVEIVGFLASGDGVRMTPSRLEAVGKLKIPKSKAELKSMLGFYTFFGHHICQFAKLAAPLWRLLKMSDNKEFCWSRCHDVAFEKLKKAALEADILSHFDGSLATYLMTDASEDAVGAVLFQIDRREKDVMKRIKIILFASKLLQTAFRNMHQFEREIFGVTWALNHCRFYISQLEASIPVIVLTDLRTAKIIMEKSLSHAAKPIQRRFDRWILSVYDINYKIEWIAGKMNIADCLSRLSTVVSSSKGSDAFERDYEIDYSDEPKLSDEELEKANEVCFVCNVAPIHIDTFDQPMPHAEIAAESLKDEEIVKALNDVRNGEKVSDIWRPSTQLVAEADGVLIRGRKIVLPASLRQRALDVAHKSHPGGDTILRLLKEFVWWPKMADDVRNLSENCVVCIALRGHPSPVPMNPSGLPLGAWQVVSMDFADFKTADATILAVVDNFSRFTRYIPIANKETATVLKEIDKLIDFYGKMEWLKHDGGPPMKGQIWKDEMEERGIKLIYSTPEYSQGNGLAERQMQRLNGAMMACWISKKPWTQGIKELERSYNATPHRTTGVPPDMAMFNRRRDIGLPCLPQNMYSEVDWETMRARDEKAKCYMKEYGDNYVKAKEPTFQVGDEVFITSDENKLTKVKPNWKLDPFTRLPSRWRIESFDGKAKRYGLRNVDNSNSFLLRDAANLYKCPDSDESRRQQEILDDITSDDPVTTEVAGIPFEIIRVMDNNSDDKIQNRNLKEAVEQTINFHVEREIRRSSRATKPPARYGRENME